ncbi:sulfurtransferase [Nakamurella leprariae]|uniref:thiosulfate sulfurtransferase n=1 Tax=Nakamurella leprariae TaxID=2803911 RepID=A0A938YF65_9ACTN|nr:sulfurtransferase [Nakamurella leprariae]MBM9469592.1 sulfurtransferase [Nakamurella leprariae]
MTVAEHRTDVVISATELKELLASGADVVVLDVRRSTNEPLEAEYRAGHIPGARFANHFTQLSGPPSAAAGRNPLPDDETIQAAVTAWGINAGSTVVVSSDVGGPTATRGWWVLKWAGVPDVRYLDGGLAAWVEAGGELDTEVPPEGHGSFRVTTGSLPVLTADQAAELARDGVLLDARPATDYFGSPDQPLTGHIPGALSAPFSIALQGGTGLLGDDQAIRAVYAAVGADGERPIGLYCGGGVGATFGVLALARLGIPAALYPGSWSQWSADAARPIATGSQPG